MRRHRPLGLALSLLGLAFLFMVAASPLDSEAPESLLSGQKGSGSLWNRIRNLDVGNNLGTIGARLGSLSSDQLSRLGKGFSSIVDTVTSGSTDAIREGASRALEHVVKFAVVKSTADEICFRILGCFSLRYPWVSIQRPVPAPKTPEEIKVQFYLYTRNRPERFSFAATDDWSLQDSDFDGSRPTFFLVHGFLNSGNETWLAELKDAILGKVDGNVFIVDWGDGAIELNYLQAVSNTRIVGREVGCLGRTLVSEYGASAADFHLMGHSLGSHICGYAARYITHVGRITAFDPAGPGFEALPQEVRLSKDAARFVEALHTNAKPLLTLGFGIMQTVGHVDLYMNGGVDQPGCALPTAPPLNSLTDIASLPKEVLDELVSCSHKRAYEYFTEAINNTSCRMWGHQVNVASQRAVWNMGIASPVPPVTGKCENAECVPVGLDTLLYPARGAFSVVTSSDSPFCIQENSEDGQSLDQLKSLGYMD